MFHPDGYVSLRRVYDLFQERLRDGYWVVAVADAEEYFEEFEYLSGIETIRKEGSASVLGALNEYERQRFKELQSRHIGGSLPMLFYATLPADNAEYRMFRAIARDVYICSPAGDLLQLDLSGPGGWEFFPDMRWADIAFDEAGERWADADLVEVRIANAAYSIAPADVRDELVISEADDPAQYLKRWMSNRALDGAHGDISHFYDRRTFVISFRTYDHLLSRSDLRGKFEREHLAGILRQFEGWSLCVRSEVLKKVPEILLNDTDHGAHRRKTGGRPKYSREAAKAAFMMRFPHGRGATSWKEIARQVRDEIGGEIGDRVSDRTVRRAVEDLEGGAE